MSGYDNGDDNTYGDDNGDNNGDDNGDDNGGDNGEGDGNSVGNGEGEDDGKIFFTFLIFCVKRQNVKIANFLCFLCSAIIYLGTKRIPLQNITVEELTTTSLNKILNSESLNLWILLKSKLFTENTYLFIYTLILKLNIMSLTKIVGEGEFSSYVA